MHICQNILAPLAGAIPIVGPTHLLDPLGALFSSGDNATFYPEEQPGSRGNIKRRSHAETPLNPQSPWK